MGPDRTQHSRKSNHANAKAGPSTSASGPGPSAGAGGGMRKQLSMEQRDPAGIPGVSKLKASIRQTRRFLAKDTLEPGLRITTERRLVSLEADLANAQKREVEKKNGSKYHQVKFFEKRKLLRIIKRAKKALAESTAGTAEDVSKSRKKTERELKEARIMLNYVRHYPNAQKYIALFPSSTPAEEEDESRTLKLPKLFKKLKSSSNASSNTKSKSNSEATGSGEDESSIKRRQVLDRISAMMDLGSLPAEPELIVGEVKNQVELGGPGGGDVLQKQPGKVDKGEKSSKKGGKGGKEANKAEDDDDFFDVDDE